MLKKLQLTAILLWIFGFSAEILKAQPTSNTKIFNFGAISSEQNLPHYATHHIMQDSYGFLWISTRDGLCRFDGASCTVFRPGNNKGLELEANLVWLTFEDSLQRIWIGTKGGGLSFFNPKTGQSKTFRAEENDQHSLSGDIVTAIFEDSDNRMWVGTDGNGLNLVRETTQPDSFYFEPVPLADSLSSQLVIMDIEQDEDGNLWIATYGNGIYVINGAQNEVLEHITTDSDDYPLADNYVMTLAPEDSLMWIGTKFGGLSKFHIPQKTIEHYKSDLTDPTSIPHNFVWDIYIDRNNTKWIGMYGGGLAMLEEGKNTFYSIADYEVNAPFTDNFVLNIMEDNQGQIWIATDNQGAFRFNTQPVYQPINLQWPEVENTSNLVINNLFLDSNDQFWISTNSGLFTAGSNFENLRKRNVGLGTSIFYEVNETADGRIWIASNQNFGYYNPATGIWGEIDIASELNTPGTDRFFDLEIDQNNQIWMASDGGLVRYDIKSGEIKLYKHRENDPKSIAGNKLANVLLEDSHIWIGTDDKGISLFNTKTEEARNIDLTEYLSSERVSDYITDISKDNEGNLLVGTADKGLYYLYKNGTRIDSVRHIRMDNGDGAFQIFDIDINDGFIITTYRSGISLIENKTFTDQHLKLPETMNTSGAKELFSIDDEIFVFNRDKIYRLYEENISPEKYQPQIQLQRLEVFNNPVTSEIEIHTQKQLALEHTDDFLTFSYTSLNLDPSTFYSTEYMLEGQDPFWLEGGESETINYTNLKPGDYVFKVRYADSSTKTNQIELGINIKTPFWQTTWFYFFVLLLVLSVIYAAFRYRTFYLLKEERTRMRIARDLHDDLSGTLSSISFFSSAAQRPSNDMKQARKFLEKIDLSAAEAKEKINDIIWAIDPSKDDWSTFLKKCKRYATDALDAKEIEYEIEIADNFRSRIKLEVRQNLWLIYKEIINNLVQHSKADHAIIEFSEKDRIIHLFVKDNGIGFDRQTENSRNGIGNIEKRAEMIGAKIELNTKKGKGTTWKLTL